MVKIFNFFKANKKIINGIFPIILILYFFGVFFPNISGAVGLSIINQGFVKITWRVIFALLLGIYTIIAFIANSLSIKRPLLLLFAFVFLILLLSSIVNISSSANVQTILSGNTKFVYIIKTGLINVLAFIGNEVLFTFLLVIGLFIVFPVIIKESTKSPLIFYFFVLSMLLITLLSFYLDRDFYIRFLHLDFSYIYEEKGISSLFPSKNAFGLFLFVALCLSFLLLYENNKKRLIIKIVLSISIILFSFVILFSFCKSSIFSMLVFYIALILQQLHKNKERHPAIFMSSIVVLIALFIFILLVIAISSLHEKGALLYVYNLIAGSSNSMVGRLSLVTIFFMNFGSYHLIFGYGPYLFNTVFSWVNTLTTDFSLDNLHNSFLMVFANGGIFYLFLYVFLLCYSFNICRHISKFRVKAIIVGAFAGIMLYSLFESNILFLSGSSGTFLFSLLFSSYAIANADMKNERKDFYEIDV